MSELDAVAFALFGVGLARSPDGVSGEKAAAFASLHIWRDLDEYRVSDAGKVQILTQVGIASTSLTRVELTRVEMDGMTGSQISGLTSVFTRVNDATKTTEMS